MPSIRCLSTNTGAVFEFSFDKPFKAVRLLTDPKSLRCAAPVASISFGDQNTTHHVPFVLRTTKSFFAINVISSAFTASSPIRQPLELRHNPLVQPIGSYRYPFSYQLTWFARTEAVAQLFVNSSSQPKLARKLTLFPVPMRHCYLTRCSRIRLPFGSEQACFCLRLTTAEVCDLSSCSPLAWILASSSWANHT